MINQLNAEYFNPEFITTYTDVSFAPFVDDDAPELEQGRSHGGKIVVWASAPVAWMSQRQSMTTLSTAEAELIEAIDGSVYAQNVESILEGMNLVVRKALIVDNLAAINLCSQKDKSVSWRTRHLRLKAVALKERQQTGDIVLKYTASKTQLADLLTKSLPRDALERLRKYINLSTTLGCIILNSKANGAVVDPVDDVVFFNDDWLAYVWSWTTIAIIFSLALYGLRALILDVFTCCGLCGWSAIYRGIGFGGQVGSLFFTCIRWGINRFRGIDAVPLGPVMVNQMIQTDESRDDVKLFVGVTDANVADPRRTHRKKLHKCRDCRALHTSTTHQVLRIDGYCERCFGTR